MSLHSVLQRLRDEKRLLKPDEIVELLQLSRVQIYRMVNEGRIPFTRLGGRIRFEPGMIADWVERQSVAC